MHGIDYAGVAHIVDSPVLPRLVLYLIYLAVNSEFQWTMISSFPLMMIRAEINEDSLFKVYHVSFHVRA